MGDASELATISNRENSSPENEIAESTRLTLAQIALGSGTVSG